MSRVSAGSETARGVCKGCKEAIVWVTIDGRWHPCNTKKFTIVRDDGGGIVTGYESHFSTCTKASAFRRAAAEST